MKARCPIFLPIGELLKDPLREAGKIPESLKLLLSGPRGKDECLFLTFSIKGHIIGECTRAGRLPSPTGKEGVRAI